jgi:peptide/nickel transport system permease protein
VERGGARRHFISGFSVTIAWYVLRRLAAALALIVAVSIGAFVLGHFAPGDATTEDFLARAGPRAIAERRARLGLDRPLTSQLLDWTRGALRFDLGMSSQYGQPVGPLVRECVWNSARLASVALVLATGIGLPLGFVTGARSRGALRAAVSAASVALVSCHPLIAALGLTLLALRTGWLSTTPGSLVVPALALGLPFAAMLERLQSRATAESLAAPDITAAAARGIPPARLLWVHVARQSLRPVLGVYGILIGSLFSGALVVEYVTAYPGLGRLMYEALVSRDLYLAVGCAFAGAAMLAAGNLAADVARALVDPRLRA